MAKRSNIDQIVEWKKRRGRSKIGAEILYKLDDLARAWNATNNAECLADFIPIRLVTLIEVYVRETVRELVDSDPKYIDRSEPLTKDIKISFATLKSLQGRLISPGDLAAHAVSVSNLTHILSIYETLIPGFRDKLPNSRERWIEDADENSLAAPLLPDPNRSLSLIEKLFGIRHIVTHETPHKQPYQINEIPELIKCTRDFLSAIDWVLIYESKGEIPRSQTAMNIAAGADLDRLNDEMKQLVAEVQGQGAVDLDAFRVSQEAWEEYANAEAELQAAFVRGGTMHSMVWSTAKAQLTSARIESLRSWLEEGEF